MSDRLRDYEEKRDYIRMQLNSEARLTVNGQQQDALCIDLSSSGMQLESKTAVAPNTEVDVEIGSKHSQLSGLAASAVVVRCDARDEEGPYLLGLQIKQMR